ncbi:MAG: S49 family peptidase [Polyangiaceae bacterium]
MKRAASDRRPFVEAGQNRTLCLHPSAMRATYTQKKINPNCVAAGVGLVYVDGPLSAKPDFWFDDYECILDRYRDAIYSDETHCVLLKIDSPGGDAAGLNELVRAMKRCKEETGKPVYVFADEGAYSAAYAIACAADEIYLPEPGGLGSVGVISVIESQVRLLDKIGIDLEVVTSGKFKADGNPETPITDQAVEHVRRRVMGLARLYWRLVADSRPMSFAAVRAMQADTYYGSEAVGVGLADGIMSLDEVVRYAAQARTMQPKRARKKTA